MVYEKSRTLQVDERVALLQHNADTFQCFHGGLCKSMSNINWTEKVWTSTDTSTVWLFQGSYLYFYKKIMPFGCITALSSEHPLKSIEMLASFAYLINKFLDLFDTIFFVLRKSYKQVTFLHVYHHILMTSISFIYIQIMGSGGHAAITGIMNSIVHVIMYGYYFVSASSPNVKNSLWWKKYITQIQIVQFVLALIHNLWPLIVDTNCAVPKIFCVFSVIQAVMMIYLFGSFYKKSYLDAKKKVQKSK